MSNINYPVQQHNDSDPIADIGRGRQTPALSWWQAGAVLTALAAVTATLVNLGIFAVAAAAGASFVLLDGTEPHQVTIGAVITSSTVPLVVGMALAVLLSRWWPGVLRVTQVVGGALALLTVPGPVSAVGDDATRLALALIHVVVGVVVVLALEAVRRRVS